MQSVTLRIVVAVPVAALLLSARASGSDSDSRELVKMPAPMQVHLLGNMRDHLSAISEIQSALGAGEFDRAAQIAEGRIGMSSLVAHGAPHMAPYMPKAMQEIGTQMHRAASQFALVAQEGAVDGNARRALASLSGVTAQCVACHNAYRAH